MNSEKMNLAIDDCMSECAVSDAPLTCLAGFLEQLRDLRQWSDEEVRQVDATVRHLLAPVINEPGDPPRTNIESEGSGWSATTLSDFGPGT